MFKAIYFWALLLFTPVVLAAMAYLSIRDGADVAGIGFLFILALEMFGVGYTLNTRREEFFKSEEEHA